MADKTPIRYAYDGSSLTGIAEYATSDTVGVAFGGTGATSLTDDGILLGNTTSAIQVTSALTTNGQIVIGGSSGPAVANISGTSNEVEITNGDGTITIGLPSTLCSTGTLEIGGNVNFDGGTFVFNDAGADKDFRIEGDTDANLFISDASTDRIGIGTATPSHLLDVEGVANFATCIVTPIVCSTTCIATSVICTTSDTVIGGDLTIAGDDLTMGTNTSGYVLVADGTNYNPVAISGDVTISSAGAITSVASNTNLTTLSNVTSVGTLTSLCISGALDVGGNVSLNGGAFIFNEAGADKDFRIEGDTVANLFITDASVDRIGIGTATPSHLLDVDGVAHVATCLITPKVCITSQYVLPSADGSAGQIMCTDGSGALAFATASGGSPGGSDTYVQFNNSSAFGGSANLTWDDTTLAIGNSSVADYLALRLYQGGGTTYYWDFTADVDAGDLIIGSNHSSFDLILNPSYGNVGIGTSTPDKELHVFGTGAFGNATGYVYIGNAGKSLSFNRDPTDGSISNSSAHAYQFQQTTSATPASDYLAVQVYDEGGTEVTANAFVINGDGKVGIGTTAPSALNLSVYETGITVLNIQAHVANFVGNGYQDSQVFIGDSSTLAAGVGGKIQFGGKYDGNYVTEWASIGGYKENGTSNNYASYFAIETRTQGSSQTERMRINSAGNVGIGVTDPLYALHVYGDSTTWTSAIRNTNSSPYGLSLYWPNGNPDNNTNIFYNAQSSAGQKAIIYSDGDMANHDGVYGTISDVKFKQDIEDARRYWDDFKQLQYRKWRDIVDVEVNPDAPYRLGLVAQEVEPIFPALVAESLDDPMNDDDGTTHKWVRSSIIEGPIMASVVQELQTRLEAAEAKITVLEEG